MPYGLSRPARIRNFNPAIQRSPKHHPLLPAHSESWRRLNRAAPVLDHTQFFVHGMVTRGAKLPGEDFRFPLRKRVRACEAEMDRELLLPGLAKKVCCDGPRGRDLASGWSGGRVRDRCKPLSQSHGRR